MEKLCIGLLTAVTAAVLAAGEVFTFVPVDRMPVYKCGEKAGFTLSVKKDGAAVKEGKYSIVYSMDSNRELGRLTVDLAQANPVTVSLTAEQPCFVLAQVWDARGKAVVNTVKSKGKKKKVRNKISPNFFFLGEILL